MWLTALRALAVTATAVFILMLGLRTLTSEDLGYHLAYGEHFLTTGDIVDDGFGTYPLVKPHEIRYDLAPGAWYDALGNYRFPNANWLTQVVMALVYRAAGMVGLSILLWLVYVGIILLVAKTLARLGGGGVGIAFGLLLVAMASYERILLRPELFGYLLLAAELFVLTGDRLTRRGIIALAVLQLLLVNFHSYFLLGLGLTGAFAVHNLGRRIWRKEARPLSAIWIAFGVQAIVCFANPWTWRLAVMPLQTLVYMRANQIAGGPRLVEGGHPWAVIGEFFSPFAEGVFEVSFVSTVYIMLLIVAGAGAICAAVLRRWAHVLVIAALTAASLTMRRNIAPAAILITPLALAALMDVLSPLSRLLVKSPTRRFLHAAAAVLLTAAGAFGAYAVATQRFYAQESRVVRMGIGASRIALPLSAGKWITEHRPEGRLWCDYNTSSNLHWFTEPHPDVPVLSNTWAYPPDDMALVQAVGRGRADYRPVFDKFNVQTVVLRVDRSTRELARRLVVDPAWAVVDIDATHIAFLRADGPNAALARRAAITPATMDVPAFIRKLESAAPGDNFPVYLGASLLSELRWDDRAVEVIDHAVQRWPRAPHVERLWDMKGICLVALGRQAFLAPPPDTQAGRELWQRARGCFVKALEINPDYTPAADHLRLIDEDLAAERKGIIYTRPGE